MTSLNADAKEFISFEGNRGTNFVLQETTSNSTSTYKREGLRAGAREFTPKKAEKWITYTPPNQTVKPMYYRHNNRYGSSNKQKRLHHDSNRSTNNRQTHYQQYGSNRTTPGRKKEYAGYQKKRINQQYSPQQAGAAAYGTPDSQNNFIRSINAKSGPDSQNNFIRSINTKSAKKMQSSTIEKINTPFQRLLNNVRPFSLQSSEKSFLNEDFELPATMASRTHYTLAVPWTNDKSYRFEIKCTWKSDQPSRLEVLLRSPSDLDKPVPTHKIQEGSPIEYCVKNLVSGTWKITILNWSNMRIKEGNLLIRLLQNEDTESEHQRNIQHLRDMGIKV
eukprot:UN22584